jgi:hypothetical protein
MLSLLAIVHTKLERAVEVVKVQRFRRSFAERIAHTGTLLEQRFPFLTAGQGGHLLIQSHMLAVGIWQYCDTTVIELQPLQQGEACSFSAEFSDLFYTLLVGIERQNQIIEGGSKGHPLTSG